ncbi:FHA domain-containing protein [Litorihabitans aurantiacus]|uniref:FHA domain-containing protein n=1 Tax=Litorihabitans aurantiacus TaxID=1930061 RepID=A0AA37UJB8_9MICO|nr:FHA domain-containing protein [Litorihabitans aurantiacus]GMA30205.1 hypothetical protein GCM10025875_01970 [Litorihabitans aurantiacus]
MSVICPEGHTSASTDYCDTCGAPIGAATTSAPSGPAAGSGAAAAGSAEAAEPTTCPHCQAPAPAGALFCENCGYDFTTGTAPSSSARFAAPDSGATPITPPAPPEQPASSLDLDPLSAPAPVAVEPHEGEGSPSDPDGEPAGAAAGEGEAEGEGEPRASGPGADGAGSGEPDGGSGDGESQDPATNAVERTGSRSLPAPAVPGPDEWVAEVWVDPDWYAEQGPEDPIPSVGMPTVVPLRSRSVLVGRPSRSRGIHPDVDCGADTGVSRRQCQLTTDGLRWFVEDLQSANGTYLSPVGEALPTSPITAGSREELEEGTRIFVGGWTRIVVRRGVPGEV